MKQIANLLCTNESNAVYKLGKFIFMVLTNEVQISLPVQLCVNTRLLSCKHSVVSCTYSIFIFDVNNSSLLNKGLHCVLIPFSSCDVQ